ncbi:MAG: DUF1682 domain-containing protein [Lachnospiraceae bacterium]|nr:DUF1682 domain-containing protein [Lachnospiraceae bacterium]
MSILGVNGALADVYQYANRAQKTATNGTSFTEQLQKTGETGASKADAYTEYLKQRYGAGVSIQNVGKDQRSMDNIGAGTAGTGNVVIASNILEQMANDPEKAAYYEKKIQDYFNSVPRFQAELSAMGHEIHSSGIVIHPDGTVTHYISGDLKPEVRAKIEAKIKAEDEEKAKRKRRYQELSQEAAQKRKQEMEIAYKKRSMTELIANQAAETSRITYAGTPETMSSVIEAYGMSALTMPGILK